MFLISHSCNFFENRLITIGCEVYSLWNLRVWAEEFQISAKRWTSQARWNTLTRCSPQVTPYVTPSIYWFAVGLIAVFGLVLLDLKVILEFYLYDSVQYHINKATQD